MTLIRVERRQMKAQPSRGTMKKMTRAADPTTAANVWPGRRRRRKSTRATDHFAIPHALIVQRSDWRLRTRSWIDMWCPTNSEWPAEPNNAPASRGDASSSSTSHPGGPGDPSHHGAATHVAKTPAGLHLRVVVGDPVCMLSSRSPTCIRAHRDSRMAGC